MRKLGIAIAIFVVLIIVALLVLPKFTDVNSYRGTIQAELEKRLNRPVSLGTMNLSLFPPALRVNDVSVRENPAFGNGQFATAQQLYVTAKLWPLLHKDFQISSLDLRRPHIELVRNTQGVWNFENIGRTANTPAQTTAQQAPAQPPTATPSQFGLDSLKIADGQVAVTDLQKQQPRAVYDHIDASVKNYAPGKPFSVSVAAHLPGKGAETIALTGTAGPLNQSSFSQSPFSGTIKLNDVALAGLKTYLNSPSLANTDGVISGTTDINNDNGKLSSRGSLTIRDARVNGVNVGYPISADYRLTNDLSSDVINVEKGDLKLGSTPVSISGTVNSKQKPSQINMLVQASNVDIADAARLASAFGVAFTPGMNVAGRATVNVRAQGAADKPAMNGTLSANDVVVSGGDLPQPVKAQSVTLALTPQDIRSNPFNAVSGGTNVNAQFTLSQYASNAPQLDAILRTANANITELLSMARAYGISAVNELSGSGTLNLDLHATGPLKNASAMSFSGTGAVRNATLKPATFRQPLNVRNADLRFNANSAMVTNLAASLGSTNAIGNVTVSNFSAPNVQFALSADRINVAELQQITSGPPQQQRSAADQAGFWDFVPRADAQQAGAGDAHPSNSSALGTITASGNIAANVMQYDQLVINNLRSGVKIDRGILTLTPITGQLYGGQETGQITANLLSTPMLVTVATKMQNVNANDLLSAVSSMKNTLYGALASSGNLRFSAASSADIARTLNGDVVLNLSNGRVAKVDILNQLATAGKSVGGGKNEHAATNFSKMGGNFTIANGIAHTNNFQAAFDGGTLAAQGAIDLASQGLNLHMTAVLDKNAAQQIGGAGAGGLMQVALANNRGELVMPVIVTGTFDNPHFAPDVEKIAEMKMNNLLPTTSNPAGAAAGVLGSVTGGKGQGGGQQGGVGGILGALGGQQQQKQQQQPAATAQPQQQPADQVNQLLNGVFGGKKNQQQQNQQPPR